jgi:hypothetical protein
MTTNEGKFKDRSVGFVPAGKVPTIERVTTQDCLLQARPPPTPDHMKKWRKSAQLEPGRTVVHPGRHDCPPPEGVRFGRINDYSDSAEELLKSGKLSQFHNVVQEHLEKNYLSSKREPLGVSMKRGHVLPSITEVRDFAFGVQTNLSENAKSVIYPSALQDEIVARENHEKYVRTHGDYDPGEQKKRGYNWGAHNVDPSVNRFGFVEPKDSQDNPAMDPKYSTVIVKKRCDDFRKIKLDELGTTKNMGFGTRSLDPDHAFGLMNTDEKLSVGDCIASGYDTHVSDDTLGKSITRSKLRAKQKSVDQVHDPTRSFGVPTVRTDISKPKVRKVTSNQNFGDDASAKTLLNPNQFTEGGVGDAEFMQKVRKEDMRAIALKPKYGLTEAIFEECWAKAVTYTQNGIVSYATFSRAVDELGY